MPKKLAPAETLERARTMLDEANALPEPTDPRKHTGWIAKIRSLLYNAQRWIERYPPLSGIKAHPASTHYTPEQTAQGQSMLAEIEQKWPKAK